MYVTKHIDWLSVTLETGCDMGTLFPTLDWRFVGRGMHGYQFRYRDALTGAIYQEAGHSDDMGVHLQFSGDALAALRSERGGTDAGLVGLLSNRHAYASRIDLTLNLHEGKLTPARLWSDYKSGRLKARATKARFIEGISDDISGDTLYIGSPKSDRQFRAYNKAAELGIVNAEAWLRLELELRALRANAAFQSCAKNGVAPTVTGHMDNFLSYDRDEYRTAISGDSVEPHDIPRKDTSRRRWLLGQVALALAKECQEDIDFKPLFDAAVQSFLDGLV